MNTTERNQDSPTPPPLTLTLFGPIAVCVHGAPLARLRSRKGLWLLALLTLRQGKPVERDWLVSTLWPDSGQSQGLAYLRQSLTELRHALGSEAMRLQTPTRATLALDLSGTSVDLLTFDIAMQQGDRTSLEHAVAVYKGPLMEGCTEEWALPERTRREQSYLAALQRLAEEALTRGETRVATDYLRRVVALDALQEGAQRLLMQALVKEGNYAAATQVYRDLRLHLHRELNAEPDPQTTVLYNQLRAQTRQKAQAVPKVVTNLSPSSPPRHLPRPLTDLLGREADVEEVTVRLRQHRLVTLTGTGGVGKTRLAIAVAETLLEEYADGAWFLDLAGLSDASLVVQAIAGTLGVREESGGALQEALVSFLQPRLLLLVMDNCEHLLGACAQLAEDLLNACMGVRILATSRQALGVTGEVNWQVPSLRIPDLEHLPAMPASLLAEVSAYASVQLFVERAEAVRKTFDLTDQNARSVAFICARLDGIPLALELAASNVRVLSIEQIAGRLDDVFRLLMRGSSTALPRQQTLRAALDWSYDLLTPTERSLLQRLSVFVGGWTLEAAEQVCADVEDVTGPDFLLKAKSKAETDSILDALTSLVDKSLVQVEERESGIRYRMLEPVRQYARDRLAESGESQRVRERHSAFFLMLAEEVSPKLRGSEQAQWLRTMEEEHDNFRQALDWYTEDAEADTQFDEKDGEKGLRLGVALQRFWWVRGYLSEGRERLRVLLAHPGGQAHTKARAEALNSAGLLAYRQGDHDEAQQLFEEGLIISREVQHKQALSMSVFHLGLVAYGRGNYARARVLYAESLEIDRELGDKRGIANTLNNLGNVAHAQGDNSSAKILYEECLALQRELGHKGGTAAALLNLGAVVYDLGHYGAARVLCTECLTLVRELGNKIGIAYSLEAFGFLAIHEAQQARSACLLGAAAALRESIGSPLSPAEREKQESARAGVKQSLGENAFAEAWSQGQAMPMEQAIEYALE